MVERENVFKGGDTPMGDDGWDDYGQEDEDQATIQAASQVPAESYNPKGYIVLRSDTVSGQVRQFISREQEMFALEEDQLILISHHYKWNTDRMNQWFGEQEQLKYKLGVEFDRSLAQRDPNSTSSQPAKHGGYCMICYEFMESSNQFSLSCRHTFCRQCWAGFLSEKVRSGYLGIEAMCMQAGCNMRVTHSAFEDIFSDRQKDKETYWKWLCKSFTDENKNIQSCPNVRCELSIERTTQNFLLYDVTCDCGTSLCFFCGQFSHRPCDCAMANRWMEKASAESENVNWISANTKSCPKCQRNIEKNQGCNHMTCTQCRFDFCWVCMGDWKEHGTATGGYYKCNVYEDKQKKDQGFAAQEKKRQSAQTELQRYMWYFERYMNHDNSQKLAVKLKPVLERNIDMLVNIKNYIPKELEFLTLACEAVVQCRDILKWTYAFGFYVENSMKENKKELFKLQQSDLEKYCDHLHGLVESDLEKYLDPNIPDRTPFFRFKDNLVSYFDATQRFYNNIVESIQDSGYE